MLKIHIQEPELRGMFRRKNRAFARSSGLAEMKAWVQQLRDRILEMSATSLRQACFPQDLSRAILFRANRLALPTRNSICSTALRSTKFFRTTADSRNNFMRLFLRESVLAMIKRGGAILEEAFRRIPSISWSRQILPVIPWDFQFSSRRSMSHSVMSELARYSSIPSAPSSQVLAEQWRSR